MLSRGPRIRSGAPGLIYSISLGLCFGPAAFCFVFVASGVLFKVYAIIAMQMTFNFISLLSPMKLRNDLFFKFFLFFFYSHTQSYREYITSSEMYSLHLTHPK